MKTTVLVLPFDLFGSAGTSRGAELLGDALRELMADNRRERKPTRARAYAKKVRLVEIALDTVEDLQNWRTKARAAVRGVLESGEFLVWITGNHLGTLPLIEEYGRENVENLLVQLDAHFDIYNLSDCRKELSHGNFLLHAEGSLPQLINIGNRELLLEPAYIRKYYSQSYSAAAFAARPEPVLKSIEVACNAAPRVFLDIDCDVLDPAWFPAVTHPVPFGLSPTQLLQIIEAASTDRLSGICVSEFDPGRDNNDFCLAALLWLLEFIFLKLYE